MRIKFIVLLLVLALAGCWGYSKSYVVSNAEHLRKDAETLMASSKRGRLESAQYPSSFARMDPLGVYVHNDYVDITTDGWNPANGVRIYADTNYTPPNVYWNGKRTERLAPGIYRFTKGPKPKKDDL